jgi:hypothetical protein
MRKAFEWKWEQLDVNSARAKVVGGWIVMIICLSYDGKKTGQSSSSVFIEDPHHEWAILQPIVDEKVERANIAKDFA